MSIEKRYIGLNAVQELVRYTQAKGWHKFTLIADERTWLALGEKAHTALIQSGADVQRILLGGETIVADEQRIVEILLPNDQQDRVFISVGSGTITDLTRFISHRLGRPFIALPTAPSVDAYSSAGSPLIVRHFKRTVMGHQPIAILADLGVLCQAPFPMIAAGVGDILGKYTALADWRLAALLWEEPIDDGIVADMYAALHAVTQNVQSIRDRKPEGITILMEALLASGATMARWGNSRPASGSEHYLSHYWELRWLQENRPPALHGAKVGVATVLIARAYAHLRAMNYVEIKARLEQSHPPSLEAEQEHIRTGCGPFAEEVLAEQDELLAPSPERWERLKQDILTRWQEIQSIARDVPPPQEIIALLRNAGAPTHPKKLGLSPAEVKDALQYSHYLRDRFTIRHLQRALGLL